MASGSALQKFVYKYFFKKYAVHDPRILWVFVTQNTLYLSLYWKSYSYTYWLYAKKVSFYTPAAENGQ